MNQTSWTPNDYSNIITIGAAAVGSVMLILFKSRCSNIKLCCGLLSCDREIPPEEVADDEGQDNQDNPPNP
tara:strand:- start:82 stop:294 length:213 start_codon:yes stop_codon:yes gene_type:complete